jgi:tartrate dehydratase beta subunit/fumarate hydratase class I family protein
MHHATLYIPACAVLAGPREKEQTMIDWEHMGMYEAYHFLYYILHNN